MQIQNSSINPTYELLSRSSGIVHETCLANLYADANILQATTVG